MHDIRWFLHNADSKSASPALVSRHDTQPLLAVAAASNDEAVIALASNLQPTYASSTSTSSSSSLPINSSDDDNTPLEVNHDAEVEITPCPKAVVSFSVSNNNSSDEFDLCVFGADIGSSTFAGRSSPMILPENDVGLVKVGTILPSNVLDLLTKHV